MSKWHFTLSDSRILILGNDPVIDVQASRSDENSLKVKFLGSKDHKKVNVTVFNSEANSFSRRFEACQTAQQFEQLWKKDIAPHLKTDSGQFQLQSSSPLSLPDVDTQPSVAKRKLCSPTSTSLMPATKIAKSLIYSETDEREMDMAIQKSFEGFFQIPIMLLTEPASSSLVREKDPVFIERLKAEMLENPLVDVQPIICIVDLPEGGAFTSDRKTSFTYQTIGGNHSREALHQLIKEHPHLKQDKLYSQKLCSVYRPMDSTLIRRLASKHNRATAFSHATTMWDRVVQCRKLLFELSDAVYSEDADPPAKKPPKWKIICASVLAQTVEQLDDAMVFHLATQVASTFSIVHAIFDAYTRGKLKGQKRPKKGLSKNPELKGSTFKCLRGLSLEHAATLLSEVAQCKISLAELQAQCVSIKQLSKVQTCFKKATNTTSWEQACELYPTFTTAEKLEPFKKLNFNKPQIPDEFLRYCQTALKNKEQQSNVTDLADDVFVLNFKTSTGIFYKKKMSSLENESLGDLFSKAKLMSDSTLKLQGFSLAVIDLHGTIPDDKEVSTYASQVGLQVRALNYGIGKQEYTLVFITKLEDLAKMPYQFPEEMCETGVLVITNKEEGIGSQGISHDTYGIVFVMCGGMKTRFKMSSAIVCEKNEDSLTEANYTFTSVKAVSFCETLISAFTSPGDWVLDGNGGIGTLLVCCLKHDRHCLSIDEDPLNFIHSKIHCVSNLNCQNQTEADN